MPENQTSGSVESVKDAIVGFLALVGGTFAIGVLAVKAGYVEQWFGFGLLTDAAILAVLAVITTTALGVLLGIVIARWLQWRYDTRLVVLNGGEDLDDWR